MKTLHLYLLRQILATLLMTVFVFTFVLLLGNILKEILGLLINRQASLGVVLHAIALLIPYVLAFALPMGMLTATLLVFGRFSADQELTAVRASGISLVSLITPILILSVVLSVLCAWINFELAPGCRAAYKELLFKIGVTRPGGILRSNQYVQFGKYTIYVDKVEADGVHVQKVMVYEADDKGDLQRWVKAASGKIISNAQDKEITLSLDNAYGATRDPNGWTPTLDTVGAQFTIPTTLPNKDSQAISISDMTFWQLWTQLDQLENASRHTLPLGKLSPPQIKEALKSSQQIRNDLVMPVLVQIHRQTAFSFACIGFTLIGIPLGIRAHRRETSAGMAMALVLVLIYYSFTILGQSWDIHPERAPHLILWLPNFIFQAVGSVLLWRANRG